MEKERIIFKLTSLKKKVSASGKTALKEVKMPIDIEELVSILQPFATIEKCIDKELEKLNK